MTIINKDETENGDSYLDRFPEVRQLAEDVKGRIERRFCQSTIVDFNNWIMTSPFSVGYVRDGYAVLKDKGKDVFGYKGKLLEPRTSAISKFIGVLHFPKPAMVSYQPRKSDDVLAICTARSLSDESWLDGVHQSVYARYLFSSVHKPYIIAPKRELVELLETIGDVYIGIPDSWKTVPFASN